MNNIFTSSPYPEASKSLCILDSMVSLEITFTSMTENVTELSATCC